MAAALVMGSEYQTPVTWIEDQRCRSTACPHGEAVSRFGGGPLLHVAPARQHVAAAALAELRFIRRTIRERRKAGPKEDR